LPKTRIVEVCWDEIDPTVAANVPLLNPAPITRPSGTAIALFEPETATANPLEGAGPLSVTVQVDVPGAFIGEGEHTTELGTTPDPVVGTIVSTALDPVDGILVPSLVDETAPVNCRVVEVSGAPVATWMVTLATIPLGITVEFRPNTMQVKPLVELKQVMVDPAAVAAGPAATVTLEISVGE
jgi:hypothetical protein